MTGRPSPFRRRCQETARVTGSPGPAWFVEALDGDETIAPKRYELLVVNADAVSLALAFPDAQIARSQGVVTVTCELDRAAMWSALDRLKRMGAQLVGVLTVG